MFVGYVDQVMEDRSRGSWGGGGVLHKGLDCDLSVQAERTAKQVL